MIESPVKSNINNKKRKLEENAKLFVEFKGLSNLNAERKKEKKTKLDSSNIKQIEKTEIAPKNPWPARKTYILLRDIDESVTKDALQDYLMENNIIFNKISMATGPLAVAYFQREKDVDKLFNICQGLHYKSNELFIVKSNIEHFTDDTATTNLSNISVHIKNLDPATTDADILALLSDHEAVQNVSINAEKCIAIIDFKDAQSAHDGIVNLDNKTILEKQIQASFLVKSQRPDQFTLKVFDLPHGFNKVDVREAFPSASKIKIVKGNNKHCLVYFKNAEDFEEVLYYEEQIYVKGAPIRFEEVLKTKKSEKAEKKSNYVLNIYNMPFDTTLKEIKQQYPNVRFVEMLKNPDGMFMGSAKLNFEEKEACEEALKNTKGLTMKHRKIRAEMKVDYVCPEEIIEPVEEMELDE